MTKGRKLGLHPIDHRPEPDFGGGDPFRELFGQGHHAHGDRQPGLDRQPPGRELGYVAVQSAAVQIHPGKLGGAAANIHHQGGVSALVQQVQTAGDGELRLLPGRDDLQLQAGLFGHAGDEFRPVLRRAAGLGGDGPELQDPTAAHLLRADLQGRKRPFHGDFRQSAGLGQPLSQAHDPGIGLHHPEAAPSGRGDQQPAIVGAQVQRAIEHRFATRAAPGGPLAILGAFGDGRFKSRGRFGAVGQGTRAQMAGERINPRAFAGNAPWVASDMDRPVVLRRREQARLVSRRL